MDNKPLPPGSKPPPPPPKPPTHVGGCAANPGGFSDAEAAALRGAAENPDKTPSAVLHALTMRPIKVAEWTLRRFCAQHRVTLEAAGSPFVVEAGVKAEKATTVEIVFAIYVLTRTGAELRRAGDAGSQDTLTSALNAIADDLPASDRALAELRRTLREHIARECVTVISPGETAAGGGDDESPLAKSRPPEAAAAGSSTS